MRWFLLWLVAFTLTLTAVQAAPSDFMAKLAQADLCPTYKLLDEVRAVETSPEVLEERILLAIDHYLTLSRATLNRKTKHVLAQRILFSNIKQVSTRAIMDRFLESVAESIHKNQ